MTLMILQVAASLLMTWAGVRTARWSKPWATGICALLLSLIVLKAVVGHIPAAEATLFPWDWYPFVEPWWYLVPSMFLLGAGLEIVWRSRWKRDLLLVGAGVLVARTGAAAWVTTRPHELTGKVQDSGVCLQSSGYSCGAAAATSFVYYYGVRASEQEMAERCLTRSGGPGLAGTSDAGLMRGLRQKLAGRYSIHIARTVYEDIPTPALVPLEVMPSVGHCVLVWRVDPELVHLLDPRCGRMTLSKTAFQQQWLGSAIWAEHE